MLSVLIPTYNYNCFPLVENLHSQADKENIPFEIICADDASSFFKEENRNINSLNNSRYVELDQNIGRSKIRNLLANEAKYEYLLFMDCDSEPVTSNYIKNYLQAAQKDTVICGGTKYKDDAVLPQYKLRYVYGKAKEEIPVEVRKKKPYDRFTTFNFLAPKAVFDVLRFNENITRYGHEDTLFGMDLRSHGYKIIHIDNPLYHLGLDENSVYIRKCKQSLENILSLSEHISKEYIQGFSILRSYSLVKRTGMSFFFRMIYRLFHVQIEKQLTGKNPDITLLSVYKLAYICYLDKRKSEN